jgi:hypothetical protein
MSFMYTHNWYSVEEFVRRITAFFDKFSIDFHLCLLQNMALYRFHLGLLYEAKVSCIDILSVFLNVMSCSFIILYPI